MGTNGRLKSVGSLWKGTCKTGTMLSGSIDMGLLGKFNIMIFPNTQNKKSVSAPDYYISSKENVTEPKLPMPTEDDL